ncbi:MAG: hypothetical protein R3223_13070 [Longimicrobiales bacterium]|nr:hypothetical protein [Longimicrobiales bacterium]
MIPAPRFVQGTRVRIQRGSFPMDPDLLGRTGMVLDQKDDRPGKYGVVLDGEERLRDFAEDELELIEEVGSARNRDDTGPTVGP